MAVQLKLAAVPILAAEMAEDIRRAAERSKGHERQFEIAMDSLLRVAVAAADLEWDERHLTAERRVIWAGEEKERSGFIDRLLFSKLLLEFKAPGLLKPTNTATANRNALDQTRNYMRGLIEKEKFNEKSIAGVVIDGFYFIFCRFSEGQWIEEAPLQTDVGTVSRFLRLLLTFIRPPLLADAVVSTFGQENDRTAKVINELYRALVKPENEFTKALYGQWRDFFSDIAGLEPEALYAKKELMAFARKVTGKQDVDPTLLLFALYTYSALLIKLIVVSTLMPFLDPALFDQLSGWSGYPHEWLKDRLEEIESGKFFEPYVTNFTEGDFFGWYLLEWTPGIAKQVHDVVRALSEFDPDTVEQAPERVRDLMKRLYHGLFPREVRHDLGEYYTPDWLAERLLKQLDQDLFSAPGTSAANRVRSRLMNTRFIDPACGSGTFLVLIIRRFRQWARELGISEREELLPALLQNVTGFDLNPLAVISSRANFLLGVADLFRPGDPPIELPVYLADSIVMPGNGETLLEQGIYKLPLRGIGVDLHIPAVLTEREKLSKLVTILTRDVKREASEKSFLRACEGELRLPRAVFRDCTKLLTDLYATLMKLHQEKRDGIWANIAKNMFMPLFIETADFVVGNPPWVNWESLPAPYRNRSKPVWEKYGLFVHSGMETILGKGKKDISMLLTYVAADQYLKTGGRLGFVITQSVFKTSGAAQGFRRFDIPGDQPLKVVAVDDLSALQPFEAATNRTAILILQKGQKTKYPLAYTIFKKKTRKSIPFTATLEEAMPLLTTKQLSAEPINVADPTSSWLTAPPRVLEALKPILGQSAYTAHAGAYSGGANAVYWLRIVGRNSDGTVQVRNITEGAKRVIKEEEHTIEPDYLFQLLRGREVKKWITTPEPDARFLVVQDPVTRMGIVEEELREECPRLYQYLTSYKTILSKRKSQSIRRLADKVFYSMFAVNIDTFSPYKVLWAEQGTFGCAVAAKQGELDVIPDHKIMHVACGSFEEAHYLCAMLNSTPAQMAIRSYTIVVQQDTHLLEHVNIPLYNPNNAVHAQLSVLSEQAHQLTGEGLSGELFGGRERADELMKVELAVDELAGAIWGLTQQQLMEIQRALADA